MTACDKNKDGHVDYSEFLRFLRVLLISLTHTF